MTRDIRWSIPYAADTISSAYRRCRIGTEADRHSNDHPPGQAGGGSFELRRRAPEMSLMISISGVRGIIGNTMTPQLAADMGCAYGTLHSGRTIVVGRDSRPSGQMIHQALVSGLMATGCHVIDVGILSTPGVALMVRTLKAAGGVVITASHNPIAWNGIKFLTDEGLAPPKNQAERIIGIYRNKEFKLADVEHQGSLTNDSSGTETHVAAVRKFIHDESIRRHRFRVVLDSVNGAGGREGWELLTHYGCHVEHINGEPSGFFAHAPEPLAENLTQLCHTVRESKAQVGFAQDPDADRLAIVDEEGRYIGEEYTLALGAMYYFGRSPGAAVANLSTSRMIDDLAAAAGGNCAVHRSPVGEANVVETMKRCNAVFGGEGNGGVIEPSVVPVRNSLVSMAIVLELMAQTGKKLSQLVADIPSYVMIKQKFPCDPQRLPAMLSALRSAFAKDRINDADGLRIDRDDGWVHVRGSNTEPIYRVIAEARSEAQANELIAAVRKITDVA